MPAGSPFPTTAIMPRTGSLFLGSRRHASRQSDEPIINSPAVTDSSGKDFGFFSLFITNPRIEKSVRDIHEQIQNQDRDRDERHDPDDQRLLAIETNGDEIIAQTRKRRHSFDYNGRGD